MANFWALEFIRTIALVATAWGLGWLVLERGWKVNYTRKILHFILFFLPIFLAPYFPFEAGTGTTLLSGSTFLLAILSMVKPVRERFAFPRVAFAALDRPEDRPFTLLWLTTQVLATYVVLIGVLVWLDGYERVTLIYITVIIAGIGDGLAEPVGVRFGRHTYTTRALFSDRRYTRSMEGSACVLLSGILACVLMRDQLVGAEFWIALAIIPAAMTLAEAWSPHTWDSPFLYLTGGATTVLTLELASLGG